MVVRASGVGATETALVSRFADVVPVSMMSDIVVAIAVRADGGASKKIEDLIYNRGSCLKK